MDEHIYWEPFSCLREPEKKNIALIKLNTPLPKCLEIFKILWNKAKIKFAVDGAANELYSLQEFERDQYLPDTISGDFDSVNSKVLEFYREKGVEIIATPDQNETDFTKALRIVCQRINTHITEVSSICVHVSFDGRLDHIIANINALFVAKTLTKIPIYLISGENMAFLIDKGCSKVDVKSQWRGGHCGLVPMNGPCHNISTTGLLYNLDNSEMAFGGLVSTSNSFSSDVVTINTDNSILFSMSLNS